MGDDKKDQDKTLASITNSAPGRAMSSYIRDRVGKSWCPNCGMLIKWPGAPLMVELAHTESECLATQVLES